MSTPGLCSRQGQTLMDWTASKALIQEGCGGPPRPGGRYPGPSRMHSCNHRGYTDAAEGLGGRYRCVKTTPAPGPGGPIVKLAGTNPRSSWGLRPSSEGRGAYIKKNCILESPQKKNRTRGAGNRSRYRPGPPTRPI